jgi:hypothetical protein
MMKAKGTKAGGTHKMPDGTTMKNSDMKGMKVGGSVMKKGYATGGALPMVEKGGKKVPAFAADGKGKMAMGGSVGTKGYIAGGKVTKGGAAGGRSAPRGR